MKGRRTDLAMRSRLIPILVARIGAVGADAGPLIREFGLPSSVRTEGEIETPVPVVRAMFEAAEGHLKDPFLGLNLALNLERGRYGVVEFAARSAPTMLEATLRMLRYQRLLNNVAVFSCERRGSSLVLEHTLPKGRNSIGRHANEFTIAQVLNTTRNLLGLHVVPDRVWFAHPEPADVGALVRYFGTENVSFNARACGIAVQAALLETPLSTSDAPLLQVLDQVASSLLPPPDPPDDPLEHVRAHVRRSLGQSSLSVAEVAATMRTSPRTLQRQLASMDTTFQRLLDEVRRDLAFDYVRDSARPINAVASALGYSDSRAFLRAFRRWAGVAPLQYRRDVARSSREAAAPTSVLESASLAMRSESAGRG